jgi:hypothetical protein
MTRKALGLSFTLSLLYLFSSRAHRTASSHLNRVNQEGLRVYGNPRH